MGVSYCTYIGAYFEMPKHAVSIKTGEEKECETCKKRYAKDSRFCQKCGAELKLVDVITTKKLQLHEMPLDETDHFMQPEYSRAVIPSNTIPGCEHLYDDAVKEISVDSVEPTKMAFRNKAAPLLKWFEENGIPVPEIKYGVVKYCS